MTEYISVNPGELGVALRDPQILGWGSCGGGRRGVMNESRKIL